MVPPPPKPVSHVDPSTTAVATPAGPIAAPASAPPATADKGKRGSIASPAAAAAAAAADKKSAAATSGKNSSAGAAAAVVPPAPADGPPPVGPPPPPFVNDEAISSPTNFAAASWLAGCCSGPSRPATPHSLAVLLAPELISELCVAQSQLCLAVAAGAHADAATHAAPPLWGDNATAPLLLPVQALQATTAAASVASVESAAASSRVRAGAGADAQSVVSAAGSRTSAKLPPLSFGEGGHAGPGGAPTALTGADAARIVGALRDELVAAAARLASAAVTTLAQPPPVAAATRVGPLPPVVAVPVLPAAPAAQPSVKSPGRPLSPKRPASPLAPSQSTVSFAMSESSQSFVLAATAAASPPSPPPPSSCPSCRRVAGAAADLQRSACLEAGGFRREAALAAAEALSVLLPGASGLSEDPSPAPAAGSTRKCASAAPLCAGASTWRLLCRGRLASLLLSAGDSVGALAQLQAGLGEARTARDHAATARLTLALADVAVRAGRPAVAMETLSAALVALLRGSAPLPGDETESVAAAAEVLAPADPDVLLAAIAGALQLDADVPADALDAAPLPPLADVAPAALVAALRASPQGQLLEALVPPGDAHSAARLEWAAAAEALARARCARLGVDVRFIDAAAEGVLAHGGLASGRPRVHCDSRHVGAPLRWLAHFRALLGSGSLALCGGGGGSGRAPAEVTARGAEFAARRFAQAVVISLHADAMPREATGAALLGAASALRVQSASLRQSSSAVAEAAAARFLAPALHRAEWFARAALAAAPAGSAAALAAASALAGVLTDGLLSGGAGLHALRSGPSRRPHDLPPPSTAAAALTDIVACELAVKDTGAALAQAGGGWPEGSSGQEVAPSPVATGPGAAAAGKRESRQQQQMQAAAAAAAAQHADAGAEPLPAAYAAAFAADLDSLAAASVGGVIGPPPAPPVAAAPAPAAALSAPLGAGGPGGRLAIASAVPAPSAQLVRQPLMPSAAVRAGYAAATRAALAQVLPLLPSIWPWDSCAALGTAAVSALAPAAQREPATEALHTPAVADVAAALQLSPPELSQFILDAASGSGNAAASAYAGLPALVVAGFLLQPAAPGADQYSYSAASSDTATAAPPGSGTAPAPSFVPGDVLLSACPDSSDARRVCVRLAWLVPVAQLTTPSEAEAVALVRAGAVAATGTAHHRLYVLQAFPSLEIWRALQVSTLAAGTPQSLLPHSFLVACRKLRKVGRAAVAVKRAPGLDRATLAPSSQSSLPRSGLLESLQMRATWLWLPCSASSRTELPPWRLP